MQLQDLHCVIFQEVVQPVGPPVPIQSLPIIPYTVEPQHLRPIYTMHVRMAVPYTHQMYFDCVLGICKPCSWCHHFSACHGNYGVSKAHASSKLITALHDLTPTEAAMGLNALLVTTTKCLLITTIKCLVVTMSKCLLVTITKCLLITTAKCLVVMMRKCLLVTMTKCLLVTANTCLDHQQKQRWDSMPACTP